MMMLHYHITWYFCTECISSCRFVLLLLLQSTSQVNRNANNAECRSRSICFERNVLSLPLSPLLLYRVYHTQTKSVCHDAGFHICLGLPDCAPSRNLKTSTRKQFLPLEKTKHVVLHTYNIVYIMLSQTRTNTKTTRGVSSPIHPTRFATTTAAQRRRYTPHAISIQQYTYRIIPTGAYILKRSHIRSTYISLPRYSYIPAVCGI